MKFSRSVTALTVLPNKLDIKSPCKSASLLTCQNVKLTTIDSIRNVAATIAFDAMEYYNGNVTTIPKVSLCKLALITFDFDD